MAQAPRRHVLDRPIARVVAGVVCLGCVAALGWLERERLWPGAASGSPADDPFVRCFAERAAQIDQMQSEGVVQAAQAELFKTRAEAMCRAEAQGTGMPPLPGQ